MDFAGQVSSLDDLQVKGFRAPGQALDLGTGSLFNGRLNLAGTGIAAEHLIGNDAAGLNVLALRNNNIAGYTAATARDYLNREVMAWGYANPGGVPADQGYLEMSRAGVGS